MIQQLFAQGINWWYLFQRRLGDTKSLLDYEPKREILFTLQASNPDSTAHRL
jgi:hypothetical protein